MNARPLIFAASLLILGATACRPAAQTSPASDASVSGSAGSNQKAPDANAGGNPTISSAAIAMQPRGDDQKPTTSAGAAGKPGALRGDGGSSRVGGSASNDASKSNGGVAGDTTAGQTVQDALNSLNGVSGANKGGAAAGPGAASATSATGEPPVDTATRKLAEPAPPIQAVLADLRDTQSQPGVVHQTSQMQMSMSMTMGGLMGLPPTISPFVTMIVPSDVWLLGTEKARSLTKAETMVVNLPDSMAGMMDAGEMMRSVMGAMGDMLTIRNGDTRWTLQMGPRLYSSSTITDSESLLSADRVPELISDVTATLEQRFTFQTLGTEDLRGLTTYHLRATPKAGDREGRYDWYSSVVLMDLWVDAKTDRLVQVSALTSSRNMMSQMAGPTPTAGGTPNAISEAMKTSEMTMIITTTVTSSESGVTVPDDFFTFSPPAGASEASGWDLFLKAAGGMFQPETEVMSLDEAKAKVGFPILVATNVPQGCQLGHTRASSKSFRLVYDCRLESRFGSVTITEGPTSDDASDVASILRDAMARMADETRTATVSGHTARWLADESLGNLLVWDADHTHIELAWSLLPDEMAFQMAEGLR